MLALVLVNLLEFFAFIAGLVQVNSTSHGNCWFKPGIYYPFFDDISCSTCDYSLRKKQEKKGVEGLMNFTLMFNVLVAIMMYYNLTSIITTLLRRYSIRSKRKYKNWFRAESYISQFRLFVVIVSFWMLWSHGG